MGDNVSLGQLDTEQINSKTNSLDTLSTSDLVKTLHQENYSVAQSLEAALPQISILVDELVKRVKTGGRLIYIGAGTSGRLGVLDASECPPTFGVPKDLVKGIIAGGEKALTTSAEGLEDLEEAGANDLKEHNLTEKDTVVGIASSGRTPYVGGGLKYAQSIGAYAVAMVNVKDSQIEKNADLVIRAVTGPEPITGSTRLKAGTSQKLMLNLITNSMMVKLGKVYGNLMVDVKATNTKLKDRAARIVMNATNCERERAEEVLAKANGSSKVAIVMQLLNLSQEEANNLLEKHSGFVRHAIESGNQ